MGKNILHYIVLCFLFSVLLTSAYSNSFSKENDKAIYDEIVFYSNGSVFSPVIILDGSAQVLWTFNDNSTTNSTKPVKDYGSPKLRKNRLKVTPWSAVRRINIGYDAQDGGSPDIEIVPNQYVSSVENLDLVAPYLKEWCSSHNLLKSLDFSNFLNLEVIESHLSQSLESVCLRNTPKLKRVNFVVNKLDTLDLRDCTNMEEILAGANNLKRLILPDHAENLWYIGSRENPLLDNRFIVKNLSKYPNIAHLSFWNSNQKGEFIMPKSDPNKFIWIRAYNNKYTSIDLRGSLENFGSIGYVDFSNNELSKVEIAGCDQIRTLNLSKNLLSSETIDHILKDLNEFKNEIDYGGEIQERNADLSDNNPPTEIGLKYKKELEAKGWKIIIDMPTITKNEIVNKEFTIYPNPVYDRFKLHLTHITKDGVILKIMNMTGQVLIEKKIYDNDTEWYLGQYSGNNFLITIMNDHVYATNKITKIY